MSKSCSEIIIWEKMCELVKIKKQLTNHLKIADLHHTNNKTSLLVIILSACHENSKKCNTLYNEIEILGASIDHNEFKKLQYAACRLYNSFNWHD